MDSGESMTHMMRVHLPRNLFSALFLHAKAPSCVSCMMTVFIGHAFISTDSRGHNERFEDESGQDLKSLRSPDFAFLAVDVDGLAKKKR